MFSGDVFADFRKLLETNPQAVEQVIRNDPWIRARLIALNASARLRELRQEWEMSYSFLWWNITIKPKGFCETEKFRAGR